MKIVEQKKLLVDNRVLSLIIVAVLFGAHDLIAQPPGMPGAPDQAPIDGGLGLLLAGGSAYALKKLRKNRCADSNKGAYRTPSTMV